MAYWRSVSSLHEPEWSKVIEGNDPGKMKPNIGGSMGLT